MNEQSVNADERLCDAAFPRSSRYHPDWMLASVSGGANALWLTEWLAAELNLRPAMRVLDLGCGRAASSIFLAREFQVSVWAADLWFDPGENQQRIRDAGLEGQVIPVRADARSLPFSGEFFDGVICIDSFPYFGTDDFCLKQIARFVRPGGFIGIAGAGMTSELEEPLPQHLAAWWTAEPEMWSIHSADWWKRHWEKTLIVDVEVADLMPDGWRRWIDWQRLVAPDNHQEIQAILADRGAHLGYVRVIARRREGVQLDDPVIRIPAEYIRRPLLRS